MTPPGKRNLGPLELVLQRRGSPLDLLAREMRDRIAADPERELFDRDFEKDLFARHEADSARATKLGLIGVTISAYLTLTLVDRQAVSSIDIAGIKLPKFEGFREILLLVSNVLLMFAVQFAVSAQTTKRLLRELVLARHGAGAWLHLVRWFPLDIAFRRAFSVDSDDRRFLAVGKGARILPAVAAVALLLFAAAYVAGAFVLQAWILFDLARHPGMAAPWWQIALGASVFLMLASALVLAVPFKKSTLGDREALARLVELQRTDPEAHAKALREIATLAEGRSARRAVTDDDPDIPSLRA